MNISGSAFRASGIATGLDTQAIIDALVGVERIPLLRLESQKARLKQQSDLYTRLSTKLKDFQKAAEAIDSAAEFLSAKATVANTSILGATATGSATPGNYVVNVTALAKAESRATDGYADANTTDVGTGTIRISSNGTDYGITLSNPTNTLEDIRNAINGSDAPVTASIINTGSATDPYKLVLTSDDTGVANAFSVDLATFTPTSAAFNLDQAGSQLQAAQDAAFTVNGLAVTRSSNTVTDAITGVNLSLVSMGQTDITVTEDNEAVKKKVKDLVTAYNDIVSIIAPQETVDGEGKANGVLFGSSGLRSITNALRSVVGNRLSTNPTGFQSLANIGIRTGEDGKLSLDETKFSAALEADPDSVVSLFTEANAIGPTGLADAIKDAVTNLTSSSGGVIKSRQDGIAARIDTIGDRVSAMERHLENVEKRLIAKFTSLETLVSGFQAQGASLQAIL